MLEIEKWANGKPPFVAALCLQTAFSAESMLEMLSYIKKQEAIEYFPQPEPNEWLRLYRNHRHVQNVVFESMKEFGGFAERLSEVFYFLSSKKIDQETSKNKEQQVTLSEEQKAAAQKYAQNFYSQAIEEIKSDLENEILPEALKQKIKYNLINFEWLFYFTVTLPCFALYGFHPTKLYRKARLGDLDALDRLLRLDKTILSDSRISIQISQSWLKKDKLRLDAINRAIAGTPNFKLTLQSIKMRLAGYISYLSEVFGYRLNEPEIRLLFNAVTIDRGSSEIIDTDLPEAPESFAKALQRSRAYWKSILPTS